MRDLVLRDCVGSGVAVHASEQRLGFGRSRNIAVWFLPVAANDNHHHPSVGIIVEKAFRAPASPPRACSARIESEEWDSPWAVAERVYRP